MSGPFSCSQSSSAHPLNSSAPMLDFARTAMFAPNVPLSDVSSSDIIMRSMPIEDKFSTGHLYLRQPQGLQIIQLVECSPPPPRQISSDIDSSSAASSSYYSSEYSESASGDEDDDEEDEEEEEEEESVCSSYCSSDLPPEELDAPASEQQSRVNSSTDTYSLRLKRIFAWREDFYSQVSSTLSEPSLPSLKRKMDCNEDDDDNVSHFSKRSRSQASSNGESSINSLGMHSCPACDAFFDTQQSLRQHGVDAKANEACSAAVEYEFE